MSNRRNDPPQVTERGSAEASSITARLVGGTSWSVPEELPVAIIYNRHNYAVMLATPTDIADFAIGFSLSEGIVTTLEDLEAIEIVHQRAGIDLHIRLSPERLERLELVRRRRNLPGRAGCGLCGLENADSLISPLPEVAAEPVDISRGALGKAMASLSDWQPLNRATRSVHAAAWCNAAGDILAAREDVGRHNALDKLIGANARAGLDHAAGFLVMSSRCSYELIEKAARAGIPALASLSAPTAFAIRKAAEANIRLYARNGSDFIALD
ncbi:formate dehydrogenase accessory sulfurtransferase FdhD [Maricaulis sp.]|uniref:formate dehydrogenase accessory sulfurtransferase FdhD n=1 Tax=Maricaulis sp. TaxID=1486257 RepID=UPI002B273DF8|nr:formate dehydrogenase accessory sulfurtransferase FdhD [Maricaulis sp.]